MASAANKLRDFGDSCDHTMDHNVPKTQSGQTLKRIPVFNTCLGSLLQHSTPLLVKSSYTNKGISDPLAEQTSPLKLELTQVAF